MPLFAARRTFERLFSLDDKFRAFHRLLKSLTRPQTRMAATIA
jgi:hypothetical protein